MASHPQRVGRPCVSLATEKAIRFLSRLKDILPLLSAEHLLFISAHGPSGAALHVLHRWYRYVDSSPWVAHNLAECCCEGVIDWTVVQPKTASGHGVELLERMTDVAHYRAD